MKYTPCLEVILNELNLSIPCFRMIYFIVLHNTLLHSTQYQYTELHCHYTTLSLHYTTLHYTTLHYTVCDSVVPGRGGRTVSGNKGKRRRETRNTPKLWPHKPFRIIDDLLLYVFVFSKERKKNLSKHRTKKRIKHFPMGRKLLKIACEYPRVKKILGWLSHRFPLFEGPNDHLSSTKKTVKICVQEEEKNKN